MNKWIALLGFLVVVALLAVIFQDYDKAALGVGLGAVAKTALDEAVEILFGKQDA